MGYGPIHHGKQGVITPTAGSWASVVNQKGFMNQNKFENTAAALVVYDASAKQRDLAWKHATWAGEIMDAAAADDAALLLVQAAFYEDTKAFNTKDHCMLVDLQFMRRMAKGD